MLWFYFVGFKNKEYRKEYFVGAKYQTDTDHTDTDYTDTDTVADKLIGKADYRSSPSGIM